MPTHADRHIPYEEPSGPRPQAGLPVLWLAAAAVLAILLFLILRAG